MKIFIGFSGREQREAESPQMQRMVRKMEQSHFFAFLNRMKYISRWGLMRNTETENIQEHSLQVAILAHALALIKNRLFGGTLQPERACLYGIFHDANEIITGDLPTPIKYFNPKINENYHEIEDISKEKLVSMLPETFRQEYRELLFFETRDPVYYPIVKAADKLAAHIKCVEEVKAGNREFEKAQKTTLQSLQEMNLPELRYFMEHYLPSYQLSLDELE